LRWYISTNQQSQDRGSDLFGKVPSFLSSFLSLSLTHTFSCRDTLSLSHGVGWSKKNQIIVSALQCSVGHRCNVASAIVAA
jgi:hypothetical protein